MAARSVVFPGIGETSYRAIPPSRTWSDEALAGFHVGEQIKRRVIGTQPVSPSWRASRLSAQIRVRWFPDSSRLKNTPTYLLIDFGRYALVTEDDSRLLEAEVPTLVDPPIPPSLSYPPQTDGDWKIWRAWQADVQGNAQAWEALFGQQARAQRELTQRLYRPQKVLTIRAWLNHAHNPYKTIRWVPHELKKKGWTLAEWQAPILDEEREARTRQLARGETPLAWNWLCVSPQSSQEDIAFWLLLYLCQAQMIEETNEVLGFVMRYLRPFCKRLHESVEQTRHADNRGSVAGDPLAGMIYEVFGRIRKGYALQEHEKGGPAYIWRVVRQVKSGPTLVRGIDPEVVEEMRVRKPRGRGHSGGPGRSRPGGLEA